MRWEVHFDEMITLDQLAAMSSLSPYYFSRQFTKAVGETPHQYIISVRIDAAKYLLKNTSLSIKEIGYRCGFSSESSFNTTFRKRCGHSPGQYRHLIWMYQIRRICNTKESLSFLRTSSMHARVWFSWEIYKSNLSGKYVFLPIVLIALCIFIYYTKVYIHFIST